MREGRATLPTPTVASGAAGALFSAGADGLKSISFTPPEALDGLQGSRDGFAPQEVVTFGAPVTGAGGVDDLTGTSTINGTVATLVVNADGSYTFTQLCAAGAADGRHDGRKSSGRVWLHGDGRRRRHGDGLS